MKLPGGFEHYSNVMEVILHADKCRLCYLMFDALRRFDQDNITKLKNSFDTNSSSSASTWTVRLWLGDLTEWKFGIDIVGDRRSCYPDLGFVIVVVTCFTGSFPKNTWKVKKDENILHGTIEVCDQMGMLPNFVFRTLYIKLF